MSLKLCERVTCFPTRNSFFVCYGELCHCWLCVTAFSISSFQKQNHQWACWMALTSNRIQKSASFLRPVTAFSTQRPAQESENALLPFLYFLTLKFQRLFQVCYRAGTNVFGFLNWDSAYQYLLTVGSSGNQIVKHGSKYFSFLE